MTSPAAHLSFRRSLSLTSRALLASFVAVALMVADARWHLLEPLRNGLSLVVRPLVALGQLPLRLWETVEQSTLDVMAVQQENDELRRQLQRLAVEAWEGAAARQENSALRALLGLTPPPMTRAIAAELLHDSPDPFTRRIVVDRGSNHGVRAGMAVVAARGLVGQVTRVQPLVSEVTLLTQEGMRVPILVPRTNLRGILWGQGDEWLALRDVLGELRVSEGDEVVTSGLDGLYPAGIPVGRVVKIEGSASAPLVWVAPAEQGERWRQLLILERLPTPAP